MKTLLVFTALLRLIDPVGDAFGNGDVQPPSAEVFRTPGIFDITEIMVPNAETLGFEITMGLLNNPWNLPNGFSMPIIEVYLGVRESTLGRQTLLPGSGMSLSEEGRWLYAFRITGEQFNVYEAFDAQGSPRDVTEEIDAQLQVRNNTIVVTTRLEIPERFSLYAMSGSYDPFSETGWRAVRPERSAWHFYSSSQSIPVLDVVADSVALQRQAIDNQVLPEIRAAFRQEEWFYIVIAGIIISLLGLLSRFFTPSSPYDT